jgi:hypothetical protein
MAQQKHVVDPSVMRQAIADQAVTDQQNRDVVLNVLHQAQVRDLAKSLGLNVAYADSAVSTLTSAELARLAGPARAAQADLAGGDVIVISVTTLLLIIIIIILLAR